MKLPSMLEHERAYIAMAKRLETLAKKAKGLEAQRLYDSSIKARRQAAMICQWREDWARTEELEGLVKRPRDPRREVH